MFHFLHLFLCTYKSVWHWSTWKLSLSRTRTPSSRVISAEERESSSREEKVDNSMVWKVGIWRCTFCILSEAPQQIVCRLRRRSCRRLVHKARDQTIDWLCGVWWQMRGGDYVAGRVLHTAAWVLSLVERTHTWNRFTSKPFSSQDF